MNTKNETLKYATSRPQELRKLCQRAVIAALMVCVLLVGAWYVAEGRFRSQEAEKEGFLTLRVLAKQMVQDQAQGVVIGKDEAEFIGSFDEFFRYVASHRPQDVSAADSPNPFPGILPGKMYGRLAGKSATGNLPLIWSSVQFNTSDGKVRYGLSCDTDIHFWGATEPDLATAR